MSTGRSTSRCSSRRARATPTSRSSCPARTPGPGSPTPPQLLPAAPARHLLVPRTPLAALCERAEGLVCLTGCARQGALVHPDERVALERCRMLYEGFGRAGLRVELQ